MVAFILLLKPSVKPLFQERLQLFFQAFQSLQNFNNFVLPKRHITNQTSGSRLSSRRFYVSWFIHNRILYPCQEEFSLGLLSAIMAFFGSGFFLVFVLIPGSISLFLRLHKYISSFK